MIFEMPCGPLRAACACRRLGVLLLSVALPHIAWSNCSDRPLVDLWTWISSWNSHRTYLFKAMTMYMYNAVCYLHVLQPIE
jgi:hypothetical protein